MGRLGGIARVEGADNLDRHFLWTPVAFGLGAAAYLEAGVEPRAWALAGLAILLGLAWWAGRRWHREIENFAAPQGWL